MKIETERLEIIPLKSSELKLWLEDIESLEKELDCLYKAEPIEGFFKEIIKGQLLITEKDEKNYLYHTFWLILRKSDRVIAETDIDGFASQNILKRCGFDLYKKSDTLWWELDFKK